MAALKPDLRNLAKLNRVLHRNDWDITWLKYPSFGTSLDGEFEEISKSVSLRVLDIDLPRYDVQISQIQHRGLTIQNPQIIDFQRTISITFLEQEDALVSRWIDLWREGIAQIRFPVASQRSFSLRDLKANLKISLLDRSLKRRALTYFVYGLWPQSVDPGQLSGEKGADIVRINVVFSYDYAHIAR